MKTIRLGIIGMNGGIAVCVVAMFVVCLLAAAAQAEIWKFDFGRKDKPKVMAGFTPVTVWDDYQKERGWGWLGLTGEVQAGWLEERPPLAGCLRSREVDDLSADYVSGGGTFALDVPDGKYVVWLMVGDWGAYEFYPRGKYTVLVNDQVIGELDQSTGAKFLPEFFVHRDTPWKSTDDVWQKYVESRFRKYQAVAEAKGGQLKVQVRADIGPGNSLKYVGPLNALVVFPEAEKAEGEAELKKIQAARRAQFEKKYAVIDLARYYVGDTTKEENDRGFAAWPVPYDGAIEINSKLGPRAERETVRLDAMVSLGEMEPVVIAVRPLDKPGRFSCAVGTLMGDKGDRLPASALTLRVAEPWWLIGKPTQEIVDEQAKKDKPVKLGLDTTIIAAHPYFLMDRDAFDGELRVNRHFWLTVKIPETAVSSTYKTNVTITGPRSNIVLPLTVTVIPVRLDRVKQAVGLNYSMPNYTGWFDDFKSEGRTWAMVEKDFRLMYDYGMTTVATGASLPKPGDPAAENRLEKMLQLYKKVGFEREFYLATTMNLYSQMDKDLGTPWDKAWQDAYVKVFRDHEAIAKKAGVPIIASIGDETTNDGREGVILQVARVAHERLKDMNLISDINGYRELTELAPLINACGFNNGWGGSFQTNRPGHELMTRDVVERVKSLGAKPWFINGGKGRYPFGIWFWKTTKWGLDGKIEWHYDASTGDPYNPLDGTSPNDFGSLVLPDQVCTVLFEQCREGIDDLRYLNYLEKLVADKKDSPDPFVKGAVARAQDALDYYLDCVDSRFKGADTPDGAGEFTGKSWPPARLAAMRREIAGLICMLRDAPVPGVWGDVAIADADTGDNPERQLGGKVTTRVKENATQGEYSFRLTFPKGQGYADQYGRAPMKDWRGYRHLVLDAVNPATKPVTLHLNLRDQGASNMGNPELRHVEKLVCVPGKNTFTISLVGMKASGADYTFDMSCLFSFFFTTDEGNEDVTLYLDNMRLTPK